MAKSKSELARACFKQLQAANPAFLESPTQTEALEKARSLAFEKATQALECLANNPITEAIKEDIVEVALIEKLLGDLEFGAGTVDTSAMERAGRHYEQALKTMGKLESPPLILALLHLELLNNTSRFYIDKGRFDQARKHLQRGIEVAKTLHSENPDNVGVIVSRILLHDAEGLIESHVWAGLHH